MICQNDISQSKKRLIFFALLLIVGALAIIVYSALTGNNNQVFTDVVNEFTALDGSNKSAEKNLFYIFSVAGILLITIFYCFGIKKTEDKNTNYHQYNYLIAATLVFSIVPIIVNASFNIIAVAALVIAIVARLIDSDLVIPASSFFFILIYSLIGLYRFFIFTGGTVDATRSVVIITAMLVTVAILFLRNKNAFIKGILFAQFFVPLSLLVYFVNDYENKSGLIKNIPTPITIRIIVSLVIFAFLIEAVYRIIKNARKETSLQETISFGALASIMAFNQYFGTGRIVNLDLHHNFEDIIGYSEIFDYHRMPFTQYIPISGLYSVVEGFFLKFLGNGLVSSYNYITNIYYFSLIIITVYLLKKHLTAEQVLFVSLIFYFGNYNRVVLMVPMFLLLSAQKVIDKKNLWLKTWVLLSLVHGLYYPVYGAAVCLGFAPLGIWQLCTYIKSDESKKDIRQIKFWIGWILCAIPVILSIPLLLGTLKHMLAMASQTLFADGVTRFGQIIPDDFLPYISSLFVRLFFYYQASYLIIISIIWLSVLMFLVNGKVHFENKKLRIDNPIIGYLSLSIAIIALVSISYSVVRCEIGDIYSRSDGFIRLSFVALIILVLRYMCHHNKNSIIVFAFACFLLAIVSEVGVNKIDADSKLQASYRVPDDFIYVKKNDQVDLLGECYIPKYNYDIIQNSYKKSCSYDKDKTYLGIVGYFGEFYLDKFKGDSVLELYLTVKGYKAVQETVDIIKQNNTIVGYSMDPVNNYYMYHYLVTSGDYVWWPDYNIFIPNDMGYTREEILDAHKPAVPGLEKAYVGKTAGSWGSSMDSLESIFTELEVDKSIEINDDCAEVKFSQAIKGDEADFIYLDFAGMDDNYQYTLITQDKEYPYDISGKSLVKYLMKKSYNPNMRVNIEWNDDKGKHHKMAAAMDEGQLLIPLGAGKGWLFDDHTRIKITVSQDNEIIQVPEIRNIRMLKLREVR